MIRMARPRCRSAERGIRHADDLDRVELFLDQNLACHLEPLVIRLRTKTLGRVGYQRLRALMLQNALVMGQMDETATLLTAIDRHWRWCPFRYVPIPTRVLAWAYARLGL